MHEAPKIVVTSPLSRKRQRGLSDYSNENREDSYRPGPSYGQEHWEDLLHPNCSVVIEDVSEDQFRAYPASPEGSKRRRFSMYEEETELEIEFTDSSFPSPSASTQSLSLPPLITRTSIPGQKKLWDGDDWKHLKELYTKAVELYERDASEDALSLLHNVIEECHRCLLVHRDPSALFLPQPISPVSSSPSEFTPPSERFSRDWGTERMSKELMPPIVESENPTAFHTILGTSLLLYGNLIARGPSVERIVQRYGRDWARPAYFYWSLALDIFCAAHCLNPPAADPSWSAAVDWELSIARGRTLLRLANEVNSRTREVTPGISAASFSSSYASPMLSIEEPNWPRNSVFSIIMSQRPPEASSFRFTTAQDLMTDAWDTLSHGILRMPRRRKRTTPPPLSPPLGMAGATMIEPLLIADSRSLSTCAKELHIISSEILSVAEQFRHPSERQKWAVSADSIFGQMKLEEAGKWQGPIANVRVKCWAVIVGSACAWDGDNKPRACLDALSEEEARNGLNLAISHLERARTSIPPSSDLEVQRRNLLEKASTGLGNILIDQSKRSEICAQEQGERERYLTLGSGRGERQEAEAMDMSA